MDMLGWINQVGAKWRAFGRSAGRGIEAAGASAAIADRADELCRSKSTGEKLDREVDSFFTSFMFTSGYFYSTGTKPLAKVLAFMTAQNHAGNLSDENLIKYLQKMSDVIPDHESVEECQEYVRFCLERCRKTKNTAQYEGNLNCLHLAREAETNSFLYRDEAEKLKKDVIDLAVQKSTALNRMPEEQKIESFRILSDMFWKKAACGIRGEFIFTSPLMEHDHVCTVFRNAAQPETPTLAFYSAAPTADIEPLEKMIDRLAAGDPSKTHDYTDCLAFLRKLQP